MLHHKLFKILHILQSFIVLHKLHIASDWGILLFCVEHKHLNKHSWHSIKVFKLRLECSVHFLFHLIEQFFHFLLREKFSILAIDSCERMSSLTDFHGLVRKLGRLLWCIFPFSRKRSWGNCAEVFDGLAGNLLATLSLLTLIPEYRLEEEASTYHHVYLSILNYTNFV